MLRRLSKFRHYNRISLITLVISVSFFIMGLSFPILSTKKHILGLTLSFEKVWLFDSIRIFYEEKEYFLAVVIFVFTVLFPVIKYTDILNRIFGWIHISPTKEKVLELTDKWSMLDVFLVALLILNFKIDSRIVVMDIRIGTLFIALSVTFRILTTWFQNLHYHLKS